MLLSIFFLKKIKLSIRPSFFSAAVFVPIAAAVEAVLVVGEAVGAFAVLHAIAVVVATFAA